MPARRLPERQLDARDDQTVLPTKVGVLVEARARRFGAGGRVSASAAANGGDNQVAVAILVCVLGEFV